MSNYLTQSKVGLGAGIALAMAIGWSPVATAEVISKGAEFRFAPLPSNGGSGERLEAFSQRLASGERSTAEKSEIWHDRSVPTWSYQPRVALHIDLKRLCRVDAATIRLLGGTAPGGGQGKSFPTGIEAFVSQDGIKYERIGALSRWNGSDYANAGVPADEGVAWVHGLKFPAGQRLARYVGFRIHGTGMTAVEQIVVEGEPAGDAPEAGQGKASDFTRSAPQLYFHKPSLKLASNVTLPVPVGILPPPGGSAKGETLTLELVLPKGVSLEGGNFGKHSLMGAQPEVLESGDRRYELTVYGELGDPAWNSRMHFGRFFLRADGCRGGEKKQLRWSVRTHSGGAGVEQELPIEVVTVPETPRLKRIMVGQGWWYPHENLAWPDLLVNYRKLGINTLSYTIASAPPLSPQSAEIHQVREAQQQGFAVSMVDMSIARLMRRHADKKEIYCQYADGKTGTSFCPSYRGEYWKDECERVANLARILRPQYVSLDIEVWKAADRLDFDFSDQVDARVCTRCEKQYQASGIKSVAQWRRAQGVELWRGLVEGARAATREAGGELLRISGYNFRPGQTYQGVWNFDGLFKAGLLDHSQVSNYNCLYPAQLASVGDRVRLDRSKHGGKAGVMPWLTPGDAGAVPGEAFRWAILEAYANGATGIWFYSSRLWDSEGMLALNEAVRAIAPVEDVIADGEVLGAYGRVKAKGRLSGMRLGKRMVLLVADYAGETGGSVAVQMQFPAAGKLIDLLTGEPFAEGLPAGASTLEISLNGERGRLLMFAPDTMAQ